MSGPLPASWAPLFYFFGGCYTPHTPRWDGPVNMLSSAVRILSNGIFNSAFNIRICMIGYTPSFLQSRSQSMPVRGLCIGMTLGKSNRNRDLIEWRDHQCCRHINACFLRELRGNIREERIINVYQIWNAKSNNINRRI